MARHESAFYKKMSEEEKAKKAAAGEPAAAEKEVKKDKEEEDPIEKLSKRYRNMARRWHQTDGDELLELYLSSFTMSFDHYDAVPPDVQKQLIEAYRPAAE